MPQVKSHNPAAYSHTIFPQSSAPPVGIYPPSHSPPRRSSNGSTSNSMQQSYVASRPPPGLTPPFSSVGPAMGYTVTEGRTSPAGYYQPGGLGDMPMGIPHSSLLLQPHSMGVLGHGPPVGRTLLPMDYIQQNNVGRGNPDGQVVKSRTHSQTDSPMAGVQVQQSPVPSS